MIFTIVQVKFHFLRLHEFLRTLLSDFGCPLVYYGDEGIVSTTESERRSGSGESLGRGDCRGGGRIPIRAIAAIDAWQCAVLYYQTFEGETSFEWPVVQQDAGGGSE